MKKTIYLIIALLCLPTLAFSQSSKEDLDLIQAAYGKSKKDIVNSYMAITTEQMTAFWTLYDEYEVARKAYGRKRFDIIQEYSSSYEILTDEKAAELMNKKIALQAEYIKIQKKYYKKVAKIIGGKQAAKFFQLEDYLENIIRLSIQESIPFIDELDNTKIEK